MPSTGVSIKLAVRQPRIIGKIVAYLVVKFIAITAIQDFSLLTAY